MVFASSSSFSHLSEVVTLRIETIMFESHGWVAKNIENSLDLNFSFKVVTTRFWLKIWLFTAAHLIWFYEKSQESNDTVEDIWKRFHKKIHQSINLYIRETQIVVGLQCRYEENCYLSYLEENDSK